MLRKLFSLNWTFNIKQLKIGVSFSLSHIDDKNKEIGAQETFQLL